MNEVPKNLTQKHKRFNTLLKACFQVVSLTLKMEVPISESIVYTYIIHVPLRTGNKLIMYIAIDT